MKHLLAACLSLMAAACANAQNNAPDIRIAHRAVPTIRPLEQGYAILQQGRLIQAQSAYDDALAIDPKNTDALSGLAAIALRQGHPDVAERHYRHILALDPRHANAIAALSDLRRSTDESRLKHLLTEQPEAPALYFALGNMHARAHRWHEAQHAWFLAYTNDAANPDVVFNLAVGLDHIGQRSLAEHYYAEALRLADLTPGNFEYTAAKARLQALEKY